jgi:hypothetical protein
MGIITARRAGITATALGIAGLGIAGLAVAAVLASSTSTPRADAAPAATAAPSVLAAKVAPALASAQAAVDALPAFLASGPQSFEGVDPTSSRSLGAKDGIRYWVAQRADGDVCLISLLPGSGQFASETCQAPTVVAASGIGLQFGDATHAVDAYFLPPGYSVTTPGYSSPSAQLAVGSAASGVAPTVAPRSALARGTDPSSTGQVTLTPFAPLVPGGGK